MTLLIAFCDLSKQRLLISVMSSKGPGSVKQEKSDVNPEWSTCNSFSSSSNDSAIFCDNSKERAGRGAKRNRNSSGSSASSVLSCVSDKVAGSSTVQSLVGQPRHNLRRNIVKKTCDCHCAEAHTTYKRTSYERIEKTSAKEITIARTNIQFRVENNGKKEVHKVTYEKSFSPSKRSEVGKEFCLHNNGTQGVHKVTYKESFSPTKSETFCLGDEQEFRKVTYEESYSPSKSDSNRKRRSEVQKLYESLHEIEWAKDFSPDNILRQINVRQAASCSMFGRQSSPAKKLNHELDGQSDSCSLTPIKRPKDELDAQSDSYSLTPIKLKEGLHEKSDPAMKPKEPMDALQSPPKGLQGDLRDHSHVSSSPRLKEDMVVNRDALNPVKRLKFDLHDTTNSSSPPRLMKDSDNKGDSSSSPVTIHKEGDPKCKSSETIKTPPLLRTLRSTTLRKRQRRVSAKSVVKYEGRRISRRINKNSSIDEQNVEDSNLPSVECFKLKENLGDLNIKKHISIKNSSINCKISSSQEFSRNNLELPNSLSAFIPRMCHGLDAGNVELTSEFSLPPGFYDISEEGICTIDACFREVGAEVVISTCHEADSEIPLLTSVNDSGLSDKAAVAEDSPPVLERCGTSQQVDSEEFLENPLVKHCQTEDTKESQLENETSDCCKVSHLEEDANEFHLENETSAISFEIPDQAEECEYLMLEDGTMYEILGHVEDSEEIQIGNENASPSPSKSPSQAEDSKDFQFDSESIATSNKSLVWVDDSKEFQSENETLATCEIFSQMDNSKEIETLATSCKSASQIEDSEKSQLENETSAVPCENLDQVEDSKEFQLENETLATPCKSPSQEVEENRTLVRSCEIPDLKESTKDFCLINDTIATPCETSGLVEDSKDFLSENKSLVKSRESLCQMEKSENCTVECEASAKSSESPCEIKDSTVFRLKNEILLQSCGSFHQTENSVEGQVKTETLLNTCKMPCQIEDEKCQLRFGTLNSVFEAEHSKNCQIKNEKETSGTDCKDSYKVQLSEDCRLQSQTLFKTYAKYHSYSFEDEKPSRSCLTYLGEGSKDLPFGKDGQGEGSFEDQSGATDFHCVEINSSYSFEDETPSTSCMTYLGEGSKDVHFGKDGQGEDQSDATDFHCVEINSSVMSEVGMTCEESSVDEIKSDLDSVCSEESAQKRDFSEILNRIVSNRFKNDSLIKQAGKRILNKYLRILRCEEREEVSQQFYVSTKDIVSPVKKDIGNSVNLLEEPKVVADASKQDVYVCKSPEKLTFNHSKSSFKTYSSNKKVMHKNIPNKTLLVQEKNSNFYQKEPVVTKYQPPEKETLSTLPSTSGVLKIDRSSTLACYYRTVLVHRFNDYTQVILRLPHFTIESLHELCDVLRRTERDPQCRALILNGIGESFGLGIDLRPLLGPDRTKTATAIAHAVKNLIEALSVFKKPLVAVVNGAAHGLAMTLLNHADTVIASEKATFCLPQLRFGYFPEGGATYTLPRIVGATRATDLITRSRVLTAQEALQINLITEVFDEKSLPLDLVDKVKVYMKTSLAGMETTKVMLKMQTRPDLLTVLENEVKLLPQMWLSDACQETMARELYL